MLSSPKIDPSKFFHVADAIFRKGNDFTGVSIAAGMGLRQYHLWTKVFKFGLTATEARTFADVLDQWVIKLIGFTRHMRQLATELEGGTLPPMLTTAEARRIAHRRARPQKQPEHTLPATDERGTNGTHPSADESSDADIADVFQQVRATAPS